MAKGKYEYWLTPEGLIKLEGWARDGLTDEQIAQNIGVCRDTLIEWKKKYSDISHALKKGKEVVDYKVENALLKRAIGYEYIETKTKTESGVVTEVTKTTKQVLPDVTAQIFWLKNRKPDMWKDKRENADNKDALAKLDEVLKEIGGVI